MTRMMVMTFWGQGTLSRNARSRNMQEPDHHHGPVEPHESPWLMTVPLIVLAVLSTVGGFIGVPYALSSVFTDRRHQRDRAHARTGGRDSAAGSARAEPMRSRRSSLQPETRAPQPVPEPAHATHSSEEITAERMLAGLSVLIALAGNRRGLVMFQKRPLLQMPRLLENKYYVDEIYDATLIRPIEAVSREGLWKIFDIGVIDGFLHSIGEAVTETGRLARYLQAGFVRGYAAIILLGALILIGLFAYLGFPRCSHDSLCRTC